MKKYRFMVLSTVLIMCVTSGAFATNGMRLIGFGPVQRAMGGVGVGATLDGAATLTNPAGMVDLGGRIDFGASFFSPSVEIDATSMGMTFKSDKGASPVPALGLIIPTAVKDLSFGIGAYGVSGMGVDYNMIATIINTNYSLMRFTPGVAYKIIDMVTVGVTANFMYATMEYSMRDNSGNQLTNMSSAAFGGGFTIGVKVKPIDMITIGFVYESTSWFQDFKFNQYEESGTVNEDTLAFDQPMNITVGVSAEPIKGLIIAFDLQWLNWAATNGNNLPSIQFDMDWEDQIVYKFGVQYTPEFFKLVTVRAGFNYGKMPVKELADGTATGGYQSGSNMAFPAVTEWHITAGVGINLSEKLSINLGAMYAPKAEVALDTTAFPGGFSGNVSMVQYSLDAGVSYKF